MSEDPFVAHRSLLFTPERQRVLAHRSRRSYAGSMTEGIALTQEMFDFCAEHNIGAEVEVVPVDQVNEAYERVLGSDVRYRFVIDISSLA